MKTQEEWFKALCLWSDKLEPNLCKYLSKMTYMGFLITPYWKIISKYKKYLANFKCELCGAKEKLQVHHITYKNRGYEHKHLNDLMAVCHRCHNYLHKSSNN